MSEPNYQKDNSTLIPKLLLRRYFLDKYHGDGRDQINVLDCCQGERVIWRRLEREYHLDSYWGVDEKHKRGRLQIDSVKILAQAGWEQNVIDIDTYGSPWNHWVALLPRVTRPLTVFLTIGRSGLGPKRAKIPQIALTAMGLTFEGISVMSALTGQFFDMHIQYCLHLATKYDVRLVEAVEAYMEPMNQWRVPYVGVRLEPM